MTFGTFNVRGIKEEGERDILLKDAQRYDIDILAIPETHIKDEFNNFNICEYVLYTVNSENSKNTHGTGILIKKILKPKFERISERICTAEIQLKHCKLLFISAYAHTSEKAEKNPELREDFYTTLESIIRKIPTRDEIIVAGDFNAKTGSGYKNFKENMGQYGKGQINSSGQRLLEMCRKSEMHLTNTIFKHKMCHRSTWTAPFRE